MNYELTPEEQQRKAVQDALMAKFQAASQDNSGIEAATEDAKRQRLIAGIGEALSGAATAQSRSRGGAASDHTLFRNMSSDAGDLVKQAILAKQRQGQDISQQMQMNSDAGKEARAITEEKMKQQDLQSELQRRADLSSQAESSNNLANQRLSEDIRHNKSSEQIANESKQAALEARMQSHQDALDAKKAAQDVKSSEGQDKAYSELRNHLETFRGNQAAKQAAVDSYSADKALDIVKGKKFLTTQDLSLLAGELSKIATGGVPTESGIQHLMPSNLSTKAAELQNFLSSSPSDAQATEYIKRNMDYLNNMVVESKKTLNGYRGNILKGYKARIKPEQYSEAEKDYGLGAASIPEISGSEKPQSGPSASGPLNSDEQDELSKLRAKYGR